jgi:hypothetical protein
MATTLQNLIDLCEADLADSGNAVWAAADITQWCRDAIADYSQHFKETASTTINAATNDHEYDLPARLVDVISVEYPDGEDPKEFLDRRNYNHPSFWSEQGYYDVVKRDNDTDPAELWVSEDVTTGNDIIVEYTADHDHTIATGANLTVPDEHHHLLRNYVIWRGLLQLKAIEEASPTSSSSLLMSQLAINVDRARRAYVDAIAKALFATSKSAVISWQDQDQAAERIY